MIKTIDKETLEAMDKRYRIRLINSINGYKSANLIGTSDRDGNENLALFSSVIHLGSNPPLLGFKMRPLTVTRHTYDNVKETGVFTINHVHRDWIDKAHACAGKQAKELSEFKDVGLTPEYSQGHKAPYVKESIIKIGLHYVEEHLIKANETIIVVGQIDEIIMNTKLIDENGDIDFESAGGVTITGLNHYWRGIKVLSRN